MTPITREQWKSVLVNSIFAFVATFVPIIIASDNLDKAALTAAATAGLMAMLKVVQKAFTDA